MDAPIKTGTGTGTDSKRVFKNEALNKMHNLLMQMREEIKKLSKLTTHQNTRRDIKEIPPVLECLVSQALASGLTNKIKSFDDGKRGKESTEGSSQTERQTGKEVTREQIMAVTNYDGFVDIKNKSWPQEMYTNSSHTEGPIIRAGSGEDMLIWDEGERAGSQTKRVMGIYPDFEEKKGEFAPLFLSKRMRDMEGKETIKEQVITKLATDGNESNCYKQLTVMKEDMQKNGRNMLAIYPPCNDDNGGLVRKMVECIFGNTSIHCKVYYTITSKNKIAKKNSDKKGKANTEAVLINKMEGKSYAELLKVVKEGMKGKEETTKDIESIRQTKNGDMIIITKKGKAGAEEIKRALVENTNVSATVRKGEKGKYDTMIFVKGFDAVTTKAEIREALIEAGNMTMEPNIGEFRPYYGSSQAVTVKLPEDTAEKILRKRELRIGYNWCRVIKRMEVIQCYRCWSFGHRAVECKSGNDRSNDCRNCGDKGHQKKECTLQMYCPICEKQGHRAGTGSCSATRKALREARSADNKTTQQENGWAKLNSNILSKFNKNLNE